MPRPRALDQLAAAVPALEDERDLVPYVDEICDLRGRLDILASRVSSQATDRLFAIRRRGFLELGSDSTAPPPKDAHAALRARHRAERHYRACKCVVGRDLQIRIDGSIVGLVRKHGKASFDGIVGTGPDRYAVTTGMLRHQAVEWVGIAYFEQAERSVLDQLKLVRTLAKEFWSNDVDLHESLEALETELLGGFITPSKCETLVGNRLEATAVLLRQAQRNA